MKKASLILGLCLALAGFAFSSGFSLKLSGSAQHLMGGGYNRIVQGKNDLYRGTPGTLVSSELENLSLGWSFGEELIYNFTDRLGVGLGIGYFAASNTSRLAMIYGVSSPYPLNIANRFSPSVSAIPVTLDLHYFLPIGDGWKLHFSTGLGLYYTIFDLETHYTVGYSSSADLTDELYGFTPHGVTAFGLQGSFGIEIALGSGISLCFDVLGRMVKAAGFEGPVSVKSSVGGRPVTHGSYTPKFPIPSIDLGGVGALVGIRIHH